MVQRNNTALRHSIKLKKKLQKISVIPFMLQNKKKESKSWRGILA